MKIVTVIPLKKAVFKEELTYFTTKEIESGDMVNIPLRNKKILGLVAYSQDIANMKSSIKEMSFNLKKITDTKGPSIFRKEFLDSVFLNGKYFAVNKNIAITPLLPAILKEEYDEISKFKNETKESGNTSKNIRIEKSLLQTSFENRMSFYKTMVRGSFAEKKSVFIVLPTERDIEEFALIASKGIENFTFSIHGGMGKKKLLENVKGIITSTHPILILGTAPFLAIPRYDIGTIVIEKENTSTYRMMNKPNFDLRTFVEIFATQINAKLIFADSLLRFETIARKETDKLSEIYPMSFRLNWSGELEILGKSLTDDTSKKEKFVVIRDRSRKEIKDIISHGNNIFIFSLRKGLATVTICKDCNEFLMCPNCSAPFVLYKSRDGTKRIFICNRCKTEAGGDTKCAHCGSWNLLPLGVGTDTVYDEIQEIFPKVKIFKLDKESVKSRKEAEKMVAEFENSKGAILIGTEMAIPYLNKGVDTSIVASFDSLWGIPNFRMSEKIIKLITSIISKTKNRLIIQTRNEKDRSLLSIKSENLLSFVREELEDRKNLDYPPYKRFIKIKFLGEKPETIKAKSDLLNIFGDYNPEIFSGFIAKQKNNYVTNALIKLDVKNWSLPELSLGSSMDEELLKKLLVLPQAFEVSVDPEDLL